MRSNGLLGKPGRRPGFTLIEGIVVMVLLAILGTLATPNIVSSMANTRADRASTALVTEIETAYSLAARQRKPVKIVVDASALRVAIQDRATSKTLRTRSFGMKESPYGVTSIAVSPSTITIFPNGVANSAFAISLTVAGKARKVTVSRVGNVRVSS